MHMSHLCCADDICSQELDKKLMGRGFPGSSAEQIEEAEKRVEMLTIEDGYVSMREDSLLRKLVCIICNGYSVCYAAVSAGHAHAAPLLC